MCPSDTISETDLFNGVPLPGAGEITIGEDFYGDVDPDDSTHVEAPDAISAAVGTPGYMERHMVQDCRIVTPDGASTEPEEFERYYFPPGDRPYEGPAPILIDIIHSDEPAVQAEEHEAMHVEFKAQWCREQGIRYVVLHDTEDMLLSAEALRAKLMGEEVTPPAEDPAVETAIAEIHERSRGVQHPRP